MNELNHGAGKGDKERSPGWRRNYDEISFPPASGFVRRGNRLVKVYDINRRVVFNHPEPEVPKRPETPGELNPNRGDMDCDCRYWVGSAEASGMCGCKDHAWVCTRPKGHEGKHRACGTQQCNMFEWNRQAEGSGHTCPACRLGFGCEGECVCER